MTQSLRKLARLRPYLRRYRGYLWWGLLALVMTNALQLWAPLILRDAIDHIEQGGGAARLTRFALAIAVLAVLSGIFRFWVRRTIIWASRKIEFDLRGDLFGHLLKLGASYYDKTPTGDIITRASSDIEGVRMLVGPGIMQGLNTLLVIAIAVPMMVALSPKLSLYVLLPLPILAVVTNIVGGIAHRRMMAIQNKFSALSAGVSESFAGIRVLKAYALEADRLDEFQRENDEYLDLNMRLVKLWGGFWPLLATMGGLTLVVVLYFGGRAVITGEIGLGTLIAFSIYLGMLLWPMIALGWVVSLYQRGVVSVERIGAILSVEPDVSDNNLPQPPAVITGDRHRAATLEIDNLRFAYPGTERHVLRGVDLVLSPGETLALVGPTASGKSTLVSLLWRRYPIGRGMIRLDGHDINDVPLDDWRSRFAAVPQESFLFSDRISKNILYGGNGSNGHSAERWGGMAALTGEAETFSDGYETIVGERGVTLSGGQKQRVALARALAAEAAILVLDDAFSAVDAETEEEILAGLGDYLAGRSAIVIAHRISTIRRADRIAFLDDGRVIESGTHDELVAAGGPYAGWVRLETIRERLERV